MRKELGLNSHWFFYKGDISFENIESYDWEAISLPHTWNNLDGQDGGNDYYQGKAWYRKKLGKELIPEGFDKDVFVRFGAASKRAEIYLNGELIGIHEGGFAAFTVSLTDKLRGENDELLVMVDNSRELPIYPMQADFTFFGGLYREASLICFDSKEHLKVDAYGVDGIFVTAQADGGVTLRTCLQHNFDGASFCLKVYEGNGEAGKLVKEIDNLPVCENASGFLEGSFTVNEAKLWDGVGSPFLYSLELELKNGDHLCDLITAIFGFRSFRVDVDEGFILNERVYPLHGVCRHQDRENMGWAITGKEHVEDMELIREIGANTVRLAHYQQAPYFYDLCDKNGMVVWAEIPFISVYDTRKEADENLLLQMSELIMQNCNHPSICFWGIANETGIGGESPEQYRILKELNSLTKKLDPTRLTTMASFGGTKPDSPLFHSTDVATYNIYKGWYEGVAEDLGPFCDEMHKELKDVPLGISEYGADAVMMWHSDCPKVKDYTEEYQAFVHEEALKAFRERPYLFGTWLWNMFDFAADARDEGGCKGRNNKGLVTYDRKTKKQAFYLYKALWSTDPFVYICGRRFTKRWENTIQVKVYSNCRLLQLIVDGKIFSEKSSDSGIFIFENVPLSAGKTVLEAKALYTHEVMRSEEKTGKDYVASDTLTIEKVNEIPAEYIFKEEKNLSEAVTQWFAGIAGEEETDVKELTVNEGCLSVFDPLEEVYKCKEGYEAIQELVAKPMAMVNPQMADRMKTGGSMSLHSIWHHISKMFPDELLYVVNERLNKIRKSIVMNPYLPLYEYIPDGEPRIFGDRLYVYGSHDFAGGELGFCPGDYMVYSAPLSDISQWHCDGVAFRRKECPFLELEPGKDAMAAPDVVKGTDGRFYMYFNLSSQLCCQVAVSDRPEGPFKYYGEVSSADGIRYEDVKMFDPGVLVDDDGKVYLFIGFNMPGPVPEKFRNSYPPLPESSLGFELADDMKTIVRGPVQIIPGANKALGTAFEGHGFYEASSPRKINGKYVMVYSTELSHELAYAISDEPLGKYEYKGVLVSNGDFGFMENTEQVMPYGNNHGGLVLLNGSWYIFYHRQTHAIECCRQGCAEKLPILPDGWFGQAEITSCGLGEGPLPTAGSYNACYCCHLTSPIISRQRLTVRECRRDTEPHIYEEKTGEDESRYLHYIANIRESVTVGYKYFDFREPSVINLKLRGDGRVKVKIFIDSPKGHLIGSKEMELTALEFNDYAVEIEKVNGKHALYFVIECVDAVQFESFTFINN